VDFAVGPDGALYYVAFNDGAVMRVAQAGGPAPEACGRTLAAAAPGLVRAAGRRVVACDPTCPTPRLPGAVRRKLARTCGAPPPGSSCVSLGCTTCAKAADLGACLGSAAASVATDVVHAGGAGAADRCSRAVRRIMLRAATARLRAVADCVRSGGVSCAAAAPAPVPKLSRVCRTPPPSLCSALRCASCSTTAQLGACVGQALIAPVDSLARTLVGG